MLVELSACLLLAASLSPAQVICCMNFTEFVVRSYFELVPSAFCTSYIVQKLTADRDREKNSLRKISPEALTVSDC